MARQPMKGLVYAGWDTSICDDDERIDELIDAQDWDGFGVYFYITQKAYRTNGYFYPWSEKSAATIARRMGGSIKSDTVQQVVNLCLRIGLWDQGLFDRESVLSSKGIQQRYMIAVEKRSENGRTVDPKIWLLNKEETKPYINIPENSVSLPENSVSLPENATKKSKVKESKGNKRKDIASPDDESSNEAEEIFISIPLNDNTKYDVPVLDVQHYKELYPAVDVEQELRGMCGWCEANSRNRKTRNGIKRFINGWLNKAQNQGGKGYGFHQGHSGGAGNTGSGGYTNPNVL